MSNGCFGKFLEDQLKYVKTNIIRKYQKAKLINEAGKPTFKTFKIINKDLVMIYHNTDNVTIDKPYAIGFTILELSKYKFYDIYYNHIKKYFKEAEVIFSDTDSYLISTNKIYKKRLDKMKYLMDYSNYDKTNKNYNNDNNSKIGLLKDETKGKTIITDFIGLGSKLYSYKTVTKCDKKTIGEVKKVKGIKKNVIQNNIRYSEFYSCIQKIKKIYKTNIILRSKSSSLQFVSQRKLAFSSFDSKR